MDLSAKFNHVLEFAQIVGFAALLVRLYTSELLGAYRCFSAYALFQVIRLTVMVLVPFHSNRFAELFFLFEPIVWILSALAILEIYESVLRNHPGIASLGRKALTGAVGASVLLSLCTLLLDFQDSAVRYPILANFFLLSRLVTVSLLLFVIFITVFLLWFPIQLKRNTVVHCLVFSAYFFVKSLVYILAGQVLGNPVVVLNIILRTVITLCCILWVVGLTREGESIPVKIGHYWDPAEEQRLMAQLDAINRTLVHSAKD